MKKTRIVKFAAIAVIAISAAGAIVMTLWNWLVPDLFGRPQIHFGQALGLLALAKILFGGFRGRPGANMQWRHRMMERWDAMTPEERERFREGIRGRCGHRGEKAAEQPAG
jgi:hypothetical protein